LALTWASESEGRGDNEKTANPNLFQIEWWTRKYEVKPFRKWNWQLYIAAELLFLII
jgi:hypothetical protein